MNQWHIGLIACAAGVILQTGQRPDPPAIPPMRTPSSPDLPNVPQLTPEQKQERAAKARERLANHGLTVSLLGIATIPTHHATLGRIGGFSSLVHAGGNRFYAASDRPDSPEVYAVTLGLTPAGDDRFALDVKVDAAPMKLAHPGKDAEGIALLPDDGGVIVSYEKPPIVSIMHPRSGDAWRCEQLEIPEATVKDIRGNRAFEAVVVRTPESGPEIWASTEAALEHDGPEATTSAGTRCRVFVFTDDGSGFTLDRQLTYVTDPCPEGPLHISFNSLSEFCPLPDGRFLSLERSFTPLSGFNGRIFILDGSARTPDPKENDPDPLPELIKAPVANIRDLGVATPGNFEGMALGPTMAEITGDKTQKGRVLLVIADDNFGSDGQDGSKIVALRVTGISGDDADANDDEEDTDE